MFDWLKGFWKEAEKQLEPKVEEVFLKVFDTIEACETSVDRIRTKYPNLNEVALAHEIIKETAHKTALIGGGAAFPDLLPGLGWGAMLASLMGDYCLTLREEMGMLMQFSVLFDRDCAVEQREKDVMSLLLFLSRNKENNAFAKDVLTDIEKAQIDILSRKILVRIGVQLGLRFMRKKLVALIPGVGIALSGGVNYFATHTLGKLGIDYFRNKAEFIRIHGQSAANLEITKKATVQMMVNLAKMGESIQEAWRNNIRDTMEIYGFSKEELDLVFQDLDREDVTPIAIKDIRQMTDEDKKYVLKQGLKMMGASISSKQENYLEFIARAFGMTQSELEQIKKECKG